MCIARLHQRGIPRRDCGLFSDLSGRWHERDLRHEKRPPFRGAFFFCPGKGDLSGGTTSQSSWVDLWSVLPDFTLLLYATDQLGPQAIPTREGYSLIPIDLGFAVPISNTRLRKE
jgi:hypothetical protein